MKKLIIIKQRFDTKIAKDYYENDKKGVKDQARDKYRNLSEEEESKKRQYGRNRYHNMSKEKKRELKKLQKNYR